MFEINPHIITILIFFEILVKLLHNKYTKGFYLKLPINAQIYFPEFNKIHRI